MHLATFIELWESKLEPQGVHKTEAAQQAVAELSDEEAYFLLPIVSCLDHQVSMTTSAHQDLPTHARSALCYWLERTDTHELTRLRDADRARISKLLIRPIVDNPVDEGMVRSYLSGDEWEAFCQMRNSLGSQAWVAHQSLEEVARLRQQLAMQLGVTTE